MATITKVTRNSGHAYKAVIRLKNIQPFSKTFKLKADAKAWATRIERNIDEARAHGNTAARQMTLSGLIEDYVTHRVVKGAASNLAWWKRELGNRKICEIDRTVIRTALRELKTGEGRRGHGYDEAGKPKTKSTGKQRAPSTVNRYKAVLSSVFEYGRENYDLPENPCRQVKGLTENNARIRFLSEDSAAHNGQAIKGERTRLLVACKESDWPQLYLLVLMALTTGARQGELLCLRWRDIRLSERRAYVAHTKNGDPRVLPLVDSVIQSIQGLPRAFDAETLLFRSTDDPYKSFSFYKHWYKALKAAGIDDFRFHDLRHSCASYLAQNGATLLQIADVLGHRQLEVTKRYAHLCVDHKQDLVDKVLGSMK